MIYFMQAGERGPVKIGWVQGNMEAVEQRRKALQTGCPQELRLLGVLPGGKDCEGLFHEGFRDHRVGGEWFYLEDFVAEGQEAITPDDMLEWYCEMLSGWKNMTYGPAA